MKLKATASLLSLLGLFGCAALVPGTREQPRVQFAPRVQQDPRTVAAQGHYELARQAHEAGLLSSAVQLYRRALEQRPDHAQALNGLGVILAQEGRTAEAIELLTRARELEPNAAHVHNNLGYTLLRQQRLDEAEVALRMARQLQPLSQQTQHNLALLEKARGERAQALGAPFQSPEANSQLGGALPSQATSTAPESASPSSAAQIVAVAPQVFELRLSGQLSSPVAGQTSEQHLGARPAGAALPAPGPTTEVAQVLPMPAPQPGHQLVFSREMASFTRHLSAQNDGTSRLEVSNGAGVQRLARRTAERLEREGVVTARLTNALHYRYQQTQIEYLTGQEAAVQAVAKRLPVSVKLVPVAHLDRHMSLKLVLGQDAAGRAITAWIQGQTPQQAQARPTTQPLG